MTDGGGESEHKIHCPFYYKIGACRHGDQCSRLHNRPTSSRSILLMHLYPAPPEAVAIASEEDWSEEQYDYAQAHLEEFYEEVFFELAKFGELEDLCVVDNVSEHMLGNIYVRYFREEDAERAVQKLNKKYYNGRIIRAEFSPVNDFREARCRAFHEARCNRGGFCNFMHIKHIPRALKRKLIEEMYIEYPQYQGGRYKMGDTRTKSDAERGLVPEGEMPPAPTSHRDSSYRDSGYRDSSYRDSRRISSSSADSAMSAFPPMPAFVGGMNMHGAPFPPPMPMSAMLSNPALFRFPPPVNHMDMMSMMRGGGK